MRYSVLQPCLKKPDLTGDKKEKCIKIIQKNGDRMLNTVNDIIEVSKIETGLLKPNTEIQSSIAPLKNFSNFSNLKFIKKNMEPEVQTSLSDDDSCIKSDNFILLSILTILVKNAIKAF